MDEAELGRRFFHERPEPRSGAPGIRADVSGWQEPMEIKPGTAEWERQAKVDAGVKRGFMRRKLGEERMRKGLTWDELKALVDGKLAEAGLDGSIEVDYLDYTGNHPPGELPDVMFSAWPGGRPKLVIEG